MLNQIERVRGKKTEHLLSEWYARAYTKLDLYFTFFPTWLKFCAMGRTISFGRLMCRGSMCLAVASQNYQLCTSISSLCTLSPYAQFNLLIINGLITLAIPLLHNLYFLRLVRANVHILFEFQLIFFSFLTLSKIIFLKYFTAFGSHLVLVAQWWLGNVLLAINFACVRYDCNGWNQTESLFGFESNRNRYELILSSFTTKSFGVSTSLNYLAFTSLPGDDDDDNGKRNMCWICGVCVLLCGCIFMVLWSMNMIRFSLSRRVSRDCIRSLTNSQCMFFPLDHIQMIQPCAHQKHVSHIRTHRVY